MRIIFGNIFVDLRKLTVHISEKIKHSKSNLIQQMKKQTGRSMATMCWSTSFMWPHRGAWPHGGWHGQWPCGGFCLLMLIGGGAEGLACTDPVAKGSERKLK